MFFFHTVVPLRRFWKKHIFSPYWPGPPLLFAMRLTTETLISNYMFQPQLDLTQDESAVNQIH